MSGCVAGTLIRVKEDKNLPLEWWKPIEQLQVDDLVLCRLDTDEDIQDYKPVAKTFKYAKKQVWAVEIIKLIDDITLDGPPSRTFIATPNHPFWKCGTARADVPEKRHFKQSSGQWLRLDQLKEGDVVKDSENNLHVIDFTMPLYQIKDSTLAWLPIERGYEGESYGSALDLSVMTNNLGRVEAKGFHNHYVDENKEYIPYLADVYNIEVSDFHTYFIGLAGIWCHSQ